MRFVPHFIPTSSSWLNLVERWFGELTCKRIRRGSFVSVPDLKRAIDEFLEAWNEQQEILGPDPWEYGLTDKNRHNMNTIAGYSHQQGLTQKKWTADDLFTSTFQGRKRGDEWRI